MMTRVLLIVAVAAALAGGCQTKPPSDWIPVPLPLEPAPSTKLVVVGTGDTAEAAREAAISQMVHQVILPPSEPENAPTAEFVQSMIRGYNVAGVSRDFLGKYYVTIELTLSQLGINYQELYHSCQTGKREMEVLRKDVEADAQLRQIAEERAQRAAEQLATDRKTFEDRMLKLQGEKKLDEQRIEELSDQRLKDEKALKAYEEQVGALEKERDALKKLLEERRAAPAADGAAQ